MSDGPAVVVIAPCAICHHPFGFNPHRVPSYDFGRGRGREPVCQLCMELVNRKRVANGTEPLPILPGAYEPMSEGEL